MERRNDESRFRRAEEVAADAIGGRAGTDFDDEQQSGTENERPGNTEESVRRGLLGSEENVTE